MRIERFPDNPIIRPNMDARMGSNINGPALIRVPDWLPDPLGTYYLYFAHHRGEYIRLAYADRLAGPWTTHEPGTLQLSRTPFTKHIASPDILIDDEHRRIVMYYHGAGGVPEGYHGQVERIAVSHDGLHVESLDEIVGDFYWRVFRWDGWICAGDSTGRAIRLPASSRPAALQRGDAPLRGANCRHGPAGLPYQCRRLPRARSPHRDRSAAGLDGLGRNRRRHRAGTRDGLRGCEPAAGALPARRHPRACPPASRSVNL